MRRWRAAAAANAGARLRAELAAAAEQLQQDGRIAKLRAATAAAEMDARLVGLRQELEATAANEAARSLQEWGTKLAEAEASWEAKLAGRAERSEAEQSHIRNGWQFVSVWW